MECSDSRIAICFLVAKLDIGICLSLWWQCQMNSINQKK